jgi:hypothetical protein
VAPAKVAGNFPNSLVKLNHTFRIEDGRISSLEIH